jgi:glycerol-3-phosphate cytidylyltransferase
VKKYPVGFTCGSFDLCHAGHMLMFKDCKNVCERLIVGLQTDPTLDPDYRDKAKNKPIMSLEERRIMLEGIKYIDEIVVYSTEADLYRLLKTIHYDVRILGSDWKGKKYTGWDLPHVAYFHDRSHDLSTSELRKRVYAAESAQLRPSKAERH